MSVRNLLAALLYVLFTCTHIAKAEVHQRLVNPSDCVSVRYLFENNSVRPPLSIDPSGTYVAYLLKSPDIATNSNVVGLYVKALSDRSTGLGRLLVAGNVLAEIQWSGSGHSITALLEVHNHVSIVSIEVQTGVLHVLTRTSVDIKEYSIDAAGDTVVFATESSVGRADHKLSAEDQARGFRIPFQNPGQSHFPTRQLYVIRRHDDSWSIPQRLTIVSPFSHRSLRELSYVTALRLQLSPSGQKLILSYIEPAQDTPAEWQQDPYIQFLRNIGFPGTPVLVLYDLKHGTTAMPFQTPFPTNTPLWSSDSRSFAVAAQAPIGSVWERQDSEDHTLEDHGVHLFVVNADTGMAEEIVRHPLSEYERPLEWDQRGGITLHTGAGETTTYARDSTGEWHESGKIVAPLEGIYPYGEMAVSDKYTVGIRADAETPPDLFIYDHSVRTARVLVELNPQFDDIRLGKPQAITWKLADGYSMSGTLLLPPDYVKGRRYPLVIQTHPSSGGFACDSGITHFPSYAPEPLAAAGIIYLTRNYQPDEDSHYPGGYPGIQGVGGLDEAAFNENVWDAAVETLDAEGLIDAKKVGIMGFSRKGWYVEFILAHAKTHYAAATVADNVTYGVGEYWLVHSPSTIREFDMMYGGPPYGNTLQSWQKYSVSYNLEKFHTPILMEEMGMGTPYDPDNPPLSLAIHFELFTGLNRLKKPVELFYYPNEAHQPDHPVARLASLLRNLDWYRFWLEDYERPNPEDKDQYLRWERLRELQKEDELQGNLAAAQRGTH